MEISHGPNVVDDGRLSDVITRVREAIRRRWLTLTLITAALFAGAAVLILLITPQYMAAARVRIDPNRSPLANTPGADAQTLSPEAIETEVAAVQSLNIARDVVKRLHLDNDPEYTKGLNEKLGNTRMSAADREEAVANALLTKLNVGRDKLTYILEIDFTSRESAKAAQIANAFAESYIASKLGSSVGNAEKQSAWFQKRLQALGDEVRAADAKVAQYRAAAGIVQGAGAAGASAGTIVDQQVAPLAAQLATAQSDAAAAHANLAAAQQQLARGDTASVGEVLSSPVIGALRRQRSDALANLQAVQARYGDKHPESIRARDQLTAIDSQIREETVRVISSLRAAVSAADARQAALASEMHRLENEQADNTRNAVLAQSLEREAAAKRAMYDRLSQLSLDSTQAAQNSIGQAVIVDRATPPSKPSYPNKPLFFALALIVSLAIGAGVIAVQEMMVTGLRTTEDVETRLGTTVLSAIPKVGRSANPADLLLEKPTSLFSESLRIARAAILGVRSESSTQVIAITSALPSEGKTTTALALARTMAINNAKTLLIECDVRRAAMRFLVQNHSNTGPGLVEVLHGEVAAKAAITAGDVPGLDHLLVRAPYFSSEDLFGNGTMERLIAEMRNDYEQIILDLPPLVGLADGRFLAVLADATALAIRWDSTPAPAAASAINWLRSDGANFVGAIFTMVDTSAEAIGGLYYSKKYSAYYQNG